MVWALCASLAVTQFQADKTLDTVCESAVKTVLPRYRALGVGPDHLAVSLVKLRPGSGPWPTGQYRGGVPFYPASVVKLFYLAYAGVHQRPATPEQERAYRDMIVDSSNEATMAVVDLLTGTTGGPELAPRAFQRYSERRNVVNRWLTELGFTGISVNQKTYGEGPYGRERQFVGPNYENRNRLTADAGARMIALVVEGKLGDASAMGWMTGLLSRAVPADDPKADAQSRGYVGGTLPPGSRLWSKAGWTDTVRHDVAVVELPGGERWALAVFTRDHSTQVHLVADVARAVWAELGVEGVRGLRTTPARSPQG